MTANRDPDRLIRAWLDLMPDEAPDRAIAAVLQATARAPQVRRLPRVATWRPPMNRLSLIAAVAVIGVALFGGVYLLSSGTGPVPTPAATRPAGAPSVPAAMWGDWAADAPSIDGLPKQGPRIHLSFSWENGIDFWIETNYTGDSPQVAMSTAWTTAPDEIRLVASGSNVGCTAGDEGWYRWQRSADGLFLTLSLVEDACALRATTLARTWVHSFAAVSDGGRGVDNATSPAILMTLPSRSFAMAAPEGANEIFTPVEGARISFVAIVNPFGYAEPCASPAGGQSPIGHTVDAFVAYAKGLPGHTVTTTDTQIDGRRAVHLDITTSSSSACPSGTVAQFSAVRPASTAGIVSVALGDPESLWAVEVGTDLFVLDYSGAVTPADEQQLIDSLSFIDALPAP